VRLFFAVELAPAVRAAAAAAARQLAAALDAATRLDARWIPDENLHVTLWFLGEVDEARTLALRDAMAVPFAMAPFDLRLGGFGVFPPSGPPRVIWMGITSGAEGLQALHAGLSVRLRPLGFEPEGRRFNPHLTLARVRQRPARDAGQAARRIVVAQAADAGVSPVEAVTLLQSHLSPRGATYDAVLRVPLVG
jgi:RNA 2',3'-cyclic 3'-phosphodiesterase